MINDADATSFTPLYAINHRGVQLFAAPYAKRAPLDGGIEPAPAATADAENEEWTGQDVSNGSGPMSSTLPLLV